MQKRRHPHYVALSTFDFEIPKGTFKDFDSLNTQFVSLVRAISSRVMRSEFDELRRDTIMPTRPSVLSNNAVDVTFPWDKRFYEKKYVDFPFQRQSVQEIRRKNLDQRIVVKLLLKEPTLSIKIKDKDYVSLCLDTLRLGVDELHVESEREGVEKVVQEARAIGAKVVTCFDVSAHANDLLCAANEVKRIEGFVRT